MIAPLRYRDVYIHIDSIAPKPMPAEAFDEKEPDGGSQKLEGTLACLQPFQKPFLGGTCPSLTGIGLAVKSQVG